MLFSAFRCNPVLQPSTKSITLDLPSSAHSCWQFYEVGVLLRYSEILTDRVVFKWESPMLKILYIIDYFGAIWDVNLSRYQTVPNWYHSHNGLGNYDYTIINIKELTILTMINYHQDTDNACLSIQPRAKEIIIHLN